MNEIYLLMFTTGLTGGVGHCMGMCGPVVVAYSAAMRVNSFLPHLLYNLGRVSTYTVLGALLGFTGSFVTLTAGFRGVQDMIMTAAGLTIIIMGLGLGGWIPLMKRMEEKMSALPHMRKVMEVFSGTLSTGSLYPLGMVFGLIPCGLVYTALLTSARTGMDAGGHMEGLLLGAASMAAFGGGTMVPLLLFGKIVNAITVKMRERLYRFSAAVMILTGIIFTLRSTGLWTI